MSAIPNTWSLPTYKTKKANWFFIVSLIAHATLIGALYKTGMLNNLDNNSIPAKTISVFLVEPTPPPPVTPPPTPKKVEKRRIVTKAPSVKKAAKKPIKKVIEPPKPQVEKKIAASPLPLPVTKSAIFESPKPSYQPKPGYPLSARRRGKEGIVTFEISVAANGQVTNAILVQSSGTSALDKSAEKAIMTWRFPPNKFNSLSSFKQKIQFRLNSN